MTDISSGQSLTGERTLPGIWHENYWFRRHEVVYRMLAERVAGERVASHRPRRILDAGCGEGYGSALLASAARCPVVGLDYDLPTLGQLRSTYSDVTPVRGNLVAMPLASGAFDAVISLQVVEHIWEQPRFVAECARLTRPGGWVALSTPNRLTFSPGLGRGEKPLNPFHVNEFDAEELVDLMAGTGLLATELLGLHHGERITAWEELHGSVVVAQLAQPYTAWPASLAALVGSLTAADFVLSDNHLVQSLDLIVSARRGR